MAQTQRVSKEVVMDAQARDARARISAEPPPGLFWQEIKFDFVTVTLSVFAAAGARLLLPPTSPTPPHGPARSTDSLAGLTRFGEWSA